MLEFNQDRRISALDVLADSYFGDEEEPSEEQDSVSSMNEGHDTSTSSTNSDTMADVETASIKHNTGDTNGQS